MFNAKTMFGYVQNYQNGFNPERLKNHEAESDEIIRQHAACALSQSVEMCQLVIDEQLEVNWYPSFCGSSIGMPRSRLLN